MMAFLVNVISMNKYEKYLCIYICAFFLQCIYFCKARSLGYLSQSLIIWSLLLR